MREVIIISAFHNIFKIHFSVLKAKKHLNVHAKKEKKKASHQKEIKNIDMKIAHHDAI